MTLGSCKVKKEDTVGAGPQKMAVNLSLIAQYAAQSNKSDVHLLLCQSQKQDRNAAPYLLSVQLVEVACIYMKTMTTTASNQIVFDALMFVNRVAMIAGGKGKPLLLRHP